MKTALSFLKDNWQAVLCIALGLAVMFAEIELRATKAEHSAYVASVEAEAAKAQLNVVKVEAEQEKNLEQVKGNHDEKHVEAVRAGAVAVVRRRVQHAAGGGSMPGIAGSLGKDDGGAQECSAAYAIVADAAQDADTLMSWQEWARLNHIPVQP